MNKRLIIMGSAPCAFEDLERIPAFDRYDFMAIGLDVAAETCALPLKYVATNHPEDITEIRRRRAFGSGNLDYALISYKPGPGVDIVQLLGPVSGSSAILGALAAIALGYEKIILCGCPLTGNAPEGNPYEAFRPGWETAADQVKGRVFSMSGWTREFLGSPAEITVGACWDGRDYYPPEYVNRLYNSVLRNTTIPFEFVLYTGPEAEKPGRTDAIDKAVRIVPTGLPYWWSGLSWWRKDLPGVTTDSVFYLDLDQVIVGSLDELMLFPSDQAYMKGYPSDGCPKGHEMEACVSTSLLRRGAGVKVWEEYIAAGMPQWDPLKPPPNAPLRLACQTIINDPKFGMAYDLYPENWIVSYRLWAKRKGIKDDVRIVAFHGRPKMHECSEEWIQEHWR